MNDETIRSAIALANKIVSSPSLIERVKENPQAELPKLAQEVVTEMPSPLKTDRWIYRIVVLSLGCTVLIVVAGAVLLSIIHGTQISPPEIMTALGSAAVGALAGLLAPSPTSR